VCSVFVSFLSKFSVSFFLSPFAWKGFSSANSKHAYENLICVHVLLLCLSSSYRKYKCIQHATHGVQNTLNSES
jgi:hypothetical protein